MRLELLIRREKFEVKLPFPIFLFMSWIRWCMAMATISAGRIYPYFIRIYWINALPHYEFSLDTNNRSYNSKYLSRSNWLEPWFSLFDNWKNVGSPNPVNSPCRNSREFSGWGWLFVLKILRILHKNSQLNGIIWILHLRDFWIKHFGAPTKPIRSLTKSFKKKLSNYWFKDRNGINLSATWCLP